MLPYDDVGEGPAVVLLHAGVADPTMWASHLGPLAEAGFRAIALELPGFGEALPAAGEQAPWADVLATLDELGVERAVLIGNSFGGAVALRVAAVAPERVTALVLVSAPAPGVEASAELEAVWAAEEAALERGDVEGAVAAVVEAWVVPDAPAAVREQVAAMQRRTFALQADAPEPAEGPDPLGDPAELDVRTLVIAGARDLPDFTADRLAAALPNARAVTLPDAGHLAPLETPEAFRELLLSFLAQA